MTSSSFALKVGGSVPTRSANSLVGEAGLEDGKSSMVAEGIVIDDKRASL